MKLSKGTCDGRNARYNHCGATDVYLGCKSRGQCIICSNKYKNAQKKPKTKVVRKKTGELSVFLELWNERPHVSQVSGEPIQFFSVSNFAHILSKGAFPSLRLEKRNIYLVTKEEHHEYDCGDRGALEKDPKWAEVFLIREELIQKHYKKSRFD